MFDYQQKSWSAEVTQERWNEIFKEKQLDLFEQDLKNTQKMEAQDDPATER